MREREGGQGRLRRRMTWRGVSILNNLLMGLPSISNFGCKVAGAIVTHIFSYRAKRDFRRVTATAQN